MESRAPHHIPGVSSSLAAQPLLDSRVPPGRLQHPLAVYAIDRVPAARAENDYVDGPAAAAVVARQPASHKAQNRRVNWLGQNQEANHNHHHNHHNQNQQNQQPHPPHHDTTTHPWISFSGRPSSISSGSSTSSDQRLLDHAAPTPTADRHPDPHAHPGPGGAAPTRTPGGFASPASKVLTSSSSSSSSRCAASCKPTDLQAAKTAGGGGGGGGGVCSAPLPPSSPAEKKHLLPCGRCGRCRCPDCTRPRPPPSCWLCHRAFLCSARSLVDAATCMCLVKAVFYHCAEDEDDEGSGADAPCSCSRAHCCARWAFMAALAAALPCLVCYLPATGLAKLGQKCYDSARRPGCRCGGETGGGGGGVEAKGGGTLEKQRAP